MGYRTVTEPAAESWPCLAEQSNRDPTGNVLATGNSLLANAGVDQRIRQYLMGHKADATPIMKSRPASGRQLFEVLYAHFKRAY